MIEKANPGLDSRVLIREEAKVEMTGFLPIESEAVHALCWVGGQGIFEEEI